MVGEIRVLESLVFAQILSWKLVLIRVLGQYHEQILAQKTPLHSRN